MCLRAVELLRWEQLHEGNTDLGEKVMISLRKLNGLAFVLASLFFAGCPLLPQPEMVWRVDNVEGAAYEVIDIKAIDGGGVYALAYTDDQEEGPMKLTRHDASGVAAWTRDTTYTAWSIVVDAEGSTYVTGNSEQFQMLMMEQRSATGNQMVAGLYGYPVASEYGFATSCDAVTHDGGLLVGSNALGGDNPDTVITSLAPRLRGRWHLLLDGDEESEESASTGVLGVCGDAAGNVYALCTALDAGEVTLRVSAPGGATTPQPVTLTLQRGAFLLKVNASGEYQWVTPLNEPYSLWKGIGLDGDGNVRVATSVSRFVPTVDDDNPGSPHPTSINRVSPDGTRLSRNTFNWPASVSRSPAVAVDTQGDFYFCTSKPRLGDSEFDRDFLYVLKVGADAQPMWEWSNQVRTPYAQFAISVNAEGDVFVLGEAADDGSASIIQLAQPSE